MLAYKDLLNVGSLTTIVLFNLLGEILSGDHLKRLIIIPILVLSWIFISCNRNPTTVKENNEQSGRRDYIWALDTISSGSFQTNLTTMWGSSSKDLWIGGYDADNSKCIYHFDGNHFNISPIPATSFIKQFYSIKGISSDNIFFIGQANYINPVPPPNFLDNGFVIQYLNGQWKVHQIPNINPLITLCIRNNNEIWAGGVKGSLYKYDGSKWEGYQLGDEKLLINCLVTDNRNELYASGHIEKVFPGQGYYVADYLYKNDTGNWFLVDSNVTSNNYNRYSYPVLMKYIDGNIYGSGENGFVKKNGDSWIILNANYYGPFDGTNSKNIFIANPEFGVNHFNGSDWYRFEGLPLLHYYDLTVFDDAIFLLAVEDNKSIIIRGILY